MGNSVSGSSKGKSVLIISRVNEERGKRSNEKKGTKKLNKQIVVKGVVSFFFLDWQRHLQSPKRSV
jgi:hypothetical protein